MTTRDPITGAEQPDEETGPAAAMDVAAEGGAMFVPGQRWRNYRIERPMENGTPGVFWGVDIGSMEPVILQNRPVGASIDWRRQASERLERLDTDRLIRVLMTKEEGGRRIEVYALPGGETLRKWIASHAPNDEVLARLTQQLAEILGSLHAEGLVHLALSADAIWVDGTAREFKVTLGGLHELTVFQQTGLIPVEVNPFMAPPEAAGLYQMPPGPKLCAWDWWTLGRVLQEVVLGRNIYEQLMNSEPGRISFEHRARAELMLLERDASGRRAGAVEAMPPVTSTMALQLLRGLLTSCRDGRWQLTDVLRCLQREPVPDRYDLPKDTRLFGWRRQAFSLPEAAAMFSQSGLWAEGVANLFDTGLSEQSLLEFLAEVPALQTELRQVQQLISLKDMPAFATAMEADRRTALAALVWLVFGDSQGVGLKLRGYQVDTAGLQRLLTDELPSEAVPLLRVVTESAYLHHVESHGGAAPAILLRQLAHTGGEAIRRAIEHGWADAADEGMQARLYQLALETDDALAARLEQLRQSYAGNRDPLLTALMSELKPARWALALLGFMGGFPLDYGFVTHAEWNMQRLQTMRTEADRLSTVLFWRRLYRIMVGSPALLAYWPVYLIVWCLPLLLAVFSRAWLEAGLVVLLGAGWRWVGQWFLQEETLRNAPGARSWTWLDHPQRCHVEAAAVADELKNTPTTGLLESWRQLQTAADALVLLSSPEPLRHPPQLLGLKAASLLGVMLVAGLCVWQSWPAIATQAEALGLIHPTLVVQQSAQPGGAPTAAPTKPAEPEGPIYEEINDGFGKHRRGPLIAWNLPPPDHPAPLAIKRVAVINDEQAAYARVSGPLLLDPYPSKNLRLILAVRVPVENGEIGLVLYNTDKRKLVDERLFLLSEAPQARTWYQVDNLKVVYLGEPAKLSQQISLAMR